MFLALFIRVLKQKNKKNDQTRRKVEASENVGKWKNMKEKEMENLPIDRYNLVHVAFYLMGVGTLMPWNLFINGKQLRISLQ